METPPSPAGRALALLIALIGISAFVWSWIGEIDIVAVAKGRIVQSDRSKLIQPLEPGIVRAIHVDEGSLVRRGDALVELDPTESAADAARSAWELAFARTRIARLKAALAGRGAFDPPDGANAAVVALQQSALASQLALHRARLSEIESEMVRRRAEKATLAAEEARQAATLPLIREQVAAKQLLAGRGNAPRLEVLDLERELLTVEYDRLAAIRRQQEIDAALAVLEDRRRLAVAEFESTATAELSEAEQQAAALEQELTKAERRRTRQILTAPVDGVVQQLSVHTVGGVVTTAEPLMVVIPSGDDLIIEAQVENKDIGFVHEGQPVDVKVDAFPFTRYGLLHGTVLDLSRDAILPNHTPAARAVGGDPTQRRDGEPVYAARVALDGTTLHVEGRDVALVPGLAVTVEIRTGRRRILDYLLSPVLEHAHGAMRER